MHEAKAENTINLLAIGEYARIVYLFGTLIVE
jgi:hypothetical protein